MEANDMQYTPQISGRQQRLYRFIQNYQAREGRPPTYAEMQIAVGISSKSLVRYHLDVLVKRGYLERAPAVARGVRPAAGAPSRDSVRVPVVGALAAEAPDAAQAAGDGDSDGALSGPEMLDLARAMAPDAEGLYALRVRGNALIDALVRDGDLVVLWPLDEQREVRDGEMVALRVRGEDATLLKRWHRENGQVRLDPVDPRCPRLYVHPAQVELEGTVVAVIRQV
jgi:repressor LexA